MAILIGLDNGMGNVKIYFVHEGVEYKIDFPSRVKSIENDSSDALYLNGKPYVFSEGRLAAELGHLTKAEEIHKLLLDKAMYEVHKITKETEFYISTNCSLDSYKNDGGDKIREFMTKEKTVSVKEKFKDAVELKIEQLACLPECLSGGTQTKLKLKHEDVIFIDIGSKNLQLIQMTEGLPRYDASFATRYGMNHIYIGISDVLKVTDNRFKSSSSIKMYLDRTGSKAYDLIPEVDGIILKYLIDNIFLEIRSRIEEMDRTPFTKFVFLGGGSTLLKRFLEAEFVNEEISFIADPYYANSKGLHDRGVKIFGLTAPAIKKKKKKEGK